MQILSNTLQQVYQVRSIHSLTSNFCGKMVYLIDQVNLKVTNAVQTKLSDSSRRIVIIAITIFSLAALAYWVSKNCSTSDVFSHSPPKPPPSLTSEIDYGKQEVLERFTYDDSVFADALSAKLFLSIEHARTVYSKDRVMHQNIDREHILDDFEFLFNQLQDEIKYQEIKDPTTFDSTSKTKVLIGILAKGNKVNPKGNALLTNIINIDAIVHNKNILSCGNFSASKVFATKEIIDGFYDSMEIPRVPLYDLHGNFI